jgi:hypothetical protein
MPIILKVDPNTGTIYTDNGTTTTPTTGTCLVMSGSPIGAIPGVQGNLALDSTSGQVYLCTVTGSTAATATWIAAFSQNNQPNNFADTQTMAALDVTGNATVGGNLSYLPYVIAPTASQTLPNNQKVICQTGTLTADITLTTGSPPVGGEAIIYGSAAAYTTTVSTGVTSGSPYIEMPDGSQVYSYVIPASSPGAGIRIVWDGTNYRATTFGQTIVAPAAASNQAVQLGQVSNSHAVGEMSSASSATTITATTASFTAPCRGDMVILGHGMTDETPNGGTGISASLGSVTNLAGLNWDATDVIETAYITMQAGDASTFSFNFTTGTAGALNAFVTAWFVPTP